MVMGERATARQGAMNDKKAHTKGTIAGRLGPARRHAGAPNRSSPTTDQRSCARYSFGVNGFDGIFRFEFASGCVWEQTEYKYSYHSAIDAIVVDGVNGI